jgi:hypothetical protein
MYKFIVLLILTACTIELTLAQDSQNMQIITEQEAQFPGGSAELIKLVYEKVEFSKEACMQEIDSEAEFSFDVMPDGKLENINQIKKIGFGIDAQLLKILQESTFEPAILMGVKVRRSLFLTIPIRTSKTMYKE